MAMALKVFQYSDGFHAWTVAVPSRPKALAAWGVKRDLFQDGSAKQIDEGPDHDAALAAPGALIERGLSVDVGKLGRTAAPKAPKTRGPSAKDRAKAEALEAELAELDIAQAAETQALEVRRAALELEAAALSRRQAGMRDAVRAKLKAARRRLI